MALERKENTEVLQLKRNLHQIFKIHNCNFAYLVGSTARQETHAMSDIDILISYPQYVDLDRDSKLSFIFEVIDIITKVTGHEEVDISILEELPLHVQYSMIKNGILIYERDWTERTDFEITLMKQYFDYAIWYERYLDMALERD